MRGAISHGEFFANRLKSMYFGPALVDAYEHCEGQQWLNFSLTDSLVKQLESVGLSMPRLNYSPFQVPYKKRSVEDLPRRVEISERNLYAFNFHGLSFMEDVITAMSLP
ncbi:MAG: hypothetical protein L0H94_05170 [Nitrospira sp.]|nr:hypothetical protein [Nitrospira sp.]